MPPVRLSLRQKHCLQWAAAGKTNWEIAQILQIAETTVNFHLQLTYAKLGVHTRAAAVAVALHIGELDFKPATA